MVATILRGRVLDFLREPEGAAGAGDMDACRFIEDGAIRLKDGRIEAVGEWHEISGGEATDKAAGETIVDHRPHLLLAGLVDAHAHFPQMQVIASWGAKLLDWLENYTFPEETKFSDYAHARTIASHFFTELARHGTTTAATYCTVHKPSAEALFDEAAARNICLIAGKVLMDRNAPDALLDTPQSAYDDSAALIEKWHGCGRAHYAITPRFAITSSPAQLEMAGALARDYPDCYIQTHVSENRDEIALTAELYPGARDYLDVYERYGLLGRRSLFGHALHLSDRERRAMAESGSVAVFCPTSNLFLGSGLFDEAGLRAGGVRCAIATDIGGGTNYSMLRTMDEGYKILQLQDQRVHPLRAFWWLTRGNAEALGLAGSIGTLEADTDADIVVLNSRATPAMSLRMETAASLSEELFILQTLGDDRAVVETYIAGKAVKGGGG